MARKARCKADADLAILMRVARFCLKSRRDEDSNPAFAAPSIRSFKSEADPAPLETQAPHSHPAADHGCYVILGGARQKPATSS